MKKLILILFVLTLLMAQCTDVNVTVVVQNDATTGDTSTVQDVGVQDTFKPKDIVVVETETETDDIELTEDYLTDAVNWDVNNEDADIDIDIDIEEVIDVGVDTNAEPDYGVDEGNDGGNDILDAGVDVSDVMDVANYGPGYWNHQCCDRFYGEWCYDRCSGNEVDVRVFMGIVKAIYNESKDCWYYTDAEYKDCCPWKCDSWGINCETTCDIQYFCYKDNNDDNAFCQRSKDFPDWCYNYFACGGYVIKTCYLKNGENGWAWYGESHYCKNGCYMDENGYPVCK